MAKFEIYDEQVIYTDGKIGAILEPNMGYWIPFSFFDNGNLDISDQYQLRTPSGGLRTAEEIYT